MKKKVLVAAVALVVIAVSFIAYAVWSSRNTARSEADLALAGFTETTESAWYCENGYGKGVANDTPWWEQVFLTDAGVDTVAQQTEQHLERVGYIVKSKYVEKADPTLGSRELRRMGIDTYNKNYAYWLIEGTSDSFSVVARVSEDLTLNNCFPSSNMDTSLNPDTAATKIVIKFKTDQD